MKQYIALLLALVMVFALGACSFSTDKPPADTQEEQAKEYVSTSENELCRFSMTLPVEREMEYEVGILMENRSDEQMSFIVDAKGYNGYCHFNGYFGAVETVEPGQTKETSFTIDKNMLLLYGVEQIDTLGVSVVAFKGENERALDGEMTLFINDDAPEADRLAFANEQTLIDENGVRVTIGNPTFDADAGTCYVMLYCENNTDADLQLSMENYTYNGGECAEYNSILMSAGEKGYDILWINTETLDRMDLTLDDFTELGFDLKLQDWNDLTVLNQQTVTYAMR